MSSYLEFNGRRVVIDLGKGQDFDPVIDFLLPLAKKKFIKSPNDDKRYFLDQVFLSHLDNDHISSIEDFDKYFHPGYLTAPCEHPRQSSVFNIIKSLFIKDSDSLANYVLDMMKKRSPGHGSGSEEDSNCPLVVCHNCAENIQLYHIPANICGKDEDLNKNYSNNTSLLLLININGHITFMPGDIMKEGMEYMIENNKDFKTYLESLGIDFLVAPHHGLTTSFPEVFFQTVKDNKTNRLNIISEKLRKTIFKEARSDVDSRYYSGDYCAGNNNIDGQLGIKTSGGHIVIDYSGDSPHVKIIDTDKTEELIKEFI